MAVNTLKPKLISCSGNSTPASSQQWYICSKSWCTRMTLKTAIRSVR